MYTQKKRVLNSQSIKSLTPNKFVKKVQGILDGKYLYRTLDGRILDFEKGSEYNCLKIFKIHKICYHYTNKPIHTKHVNRKRKKK